MPGAKHAATDASFRTSVLRNLGGGALLVVLVAGVFWAIGMVGRADDGVVAADTSEHMLEEDDTSDDDGAEPEPSAEPESDAEPDSDPASEPESNPEADSDPEPDPDADADPDPEPEAEPDPEPEPEPESPSIPPGDISVQVLDGFQADGGAAASDVAASLDDAGYRIVARNPAVRYDVTTVLWTAGNEGAGRQVAAAIGATEVREQPGNLSDAVAVHVVVGADRG